VVRRFRLISAVAAAVLAVSGAAAGSAQAATPSPTKGVVLVTTNLAYQGARAAGTGIVLTGSGEVLTNNHVIRGATTINVTVPQSKHKYTAQVVGYDIADDIALLKLDGASGLATATRGNSSKLRIGQTTTAVGNANGGGKLVVTTGKITGLGRSITVSDDQGGASRLTGLIQTSARLVPGDSGGPLLDASGRVIGVDAAGSAGYAVSASDGYAIPINRAMALVRQMEAGNASSLVHIGKTAFLGVSVEAAEGGVVVGSVVDGGPAANAGLAKGYTITAVDGRQVSSLTDVRTALFSHHPGDSITVAYVDTLGNQTSTTIALADGPPQ
jgi:S1-C subfamily serine protease